jgi:hypothetical protein
MVGLVIKAGSKFYFQPGFFIAIFANAGKFDIFKNYLKITQKGK